MNRFTRAALVAASAASTATLVPTQANAASDPFIGEIMMTAANYCPRGWAEANGQLLEISSNTALFSLLGTTYGGDGRTTFALPDMRSRFPSHTGGDLRQGSASVVAGDEGGTLGVTVLRFCIALQGIYPSRS